MMSHILSIHFLSTMLFIFFFLPISTYADILVGEGYGKTENEAKKEALADLSSAIQADVQSNFESITKKSGEDADIYAKKVMRVKSELPILGADFTLSTLQEWILAEAKLNPKRVLRLYDEKLKEIHKEVVSLMTALKNEKSNSRKHQILTDLLTYMNQYYKYKTVALLLGKQNIPQISITEAEIKKQLRDLEEKVDSIDLAAKLIAKGINKKGIYVYPPRTSDSNEITQFGSVAKDRLSIYLKTAQLPKKAEYFMTGKYEILKDGINLIYNLLDSDFNTLKTRVVTLSQNAYEGYEIYPKTIDFDKLLHSGVVVSNEFRVEINTNKGRRDLLFKDKEEVKILIKSNRSGYFYIAGHVVKPKEKYSYLLELNEGTGNRKFVRFINADDINKWISLGEFEVVTPFGVESLQLIASTNDLIDKLPSHRYDSKTGLYIISKDPKIGIQRTRALKKKISEEEKSAEAVLMFTTMK